MNLDKVEGKMKELKGKAKQSIGRKTGGDRMAASGAKDEVAGKVQSKWGEVKDKAKSGSRP